MDMYMQTSLYDNNRKIKNYSDLYHIVMFAFQTVALMLVLVVILLFLTKPKIFFTSGGQVKAFGIDTEGEDTTPFTLVVFIYGFVLMLYSICVFADLST